MWIYIVIVLFVVVFLIIDSKNNSVKKRDPSLKRALDRVVLARRKIHTDKVESKKLLIKTIKYFDENFDGDHPEMTEALAWLGKIYSIDNDFISAEYFLKKASKVSETYFPSHPNLKTPFDYNRAQYFLGYLEDHEQILSALAEVYRLQKKYTLAEEYMIKSIKLFEVAIHVDDQKIAYLLLALGDIYKEQNKVELAEESYARANKILNINRSAEVTSLLLDKLQNQKK